MGRRMFTPMGGDRWTFNWDGKRRTLTRTFGERAADRERALQAGTQAKLLRRWLHPFGDALVS